MYKGVNDSIGLVVANNAERDLDLKQGIRDLRTQISDLRFIPEPAEKGQRFCGLDLLLVQLPLSEEHYLFSFRKGDGVGTDTPTKY